MGQGGVKNCGSLMQSGYHSDAGKPSKEVIVITPIFRWRKRKSEIKPFFQDASAINGESEILH